MIGTMVQHDPKIELILEIIEDLKTQINQLSENGNKCGDKYILLGTSTSRALRKIRNSAGLTQTELADLMRLPCQSISQWECGARYPKIDALQHAANVTGMDIDIVLMPRTNSQKYNAIISTLDDSQMGYALEKIRYTRKLLGLTQGELAERIGISVMSMRRYERGERVMPLKVSTKISQIFEQMLACNQKGSNP